MTTRVLEDSEIKKIFDCVDGCNATRNRSVLTVGIGLADPPTAAIKMTTTYSRSHFACSPSTFPDA